MKSPFHIVLTNGSKKGGTLWDILRFKFKTGDKSVNNLGNSRKLVE